MANILLVEDEKSTIVLLAQALKKAGHTVTTAGNAIFVMAARAGQENDNAIFLAGKERILVGMREAGVPDG